MEKIELGTSDGAVENIEKIAELFPQVVTEIQSSDGELERAVDFDALRDLLGDVAEGQRERYQFTWPGKREAKAEARRPIYKTMIPEPGKSKDWDTTENLYIEGDNLDALKILKETYAGKVKLIYIDPPYNTGHDFVYDDDFAKTRGEYDAESGDYDEEGGRLVANTEGNGRFHSDWCSMIYPRLLLARDLLRADGVLLVSIDDHEFANLKKIADEVFGASNHVATFLWTKTATPGSLSKKSRKTVEYILAYEKIASNQKYFGSFLDNQDNPLLKSSNPLKKIVFPAKSVVFKFLQEGMLPAGDYENGRLSSDVVVRDSVNTEAFEFECHSTWQQSMVDSEVAKGTYFLVKTEKLAIRFQRVGSEGYKTPNNLIDQVITLDASLGVGTNETASSELYGLGLENIMDYPKPVSLICYLINMICKFDSNSLVVDFFSGSASTAHAVMKLNADDGASRKFILVQIPDSLHSEKQLTDCCLETICDLGEQRIRCAGDKIAADIDKENEQLELGAEPKPYPDLGFRVLRIDSTNFKDSYFTPGETQQADLFGMVDNVKEGRTDLDLLFEVLPKLGIPYSAKIEERTLAGKKVFFVDGDKLAACFDQNVGADTIEEMAKAKPWYAVIRDSSMADDATHANYEELFRTYSPDTVPQAI